MGNYPYASSYISGDPSHPLPPWPMREACARMVVSIPPSFSTPHLDLSNALEGSLSRRSLQTGGRAARDTASDLDGLEKISQPSSDALIPHLLVGLREAAGLLYNITGSMSCYTLDATGPAAGNTGAWDFQWCSELDGQEVPYYPTTGRTDMFWDAGPFDLAAINKHCMEAWGLKPRVHHSFVQFGGVEAARMASNIVFSNGVGG